MCVKLPQVSVKCKSSENFASLLWNILGWWAVQYKPCKWRVDNIRCIYYVIKNVGAGQWERYIVYSCGYIQMFLVEQLLSIHINLAWRATHPCCWYYAFILPIGRYTANWRWRKAVSLLSIQHYLFLSSKIQTMFWTIIMLNCQIQIMNEDIILA